MVFSGFWCSAFTLGSKMMALVLGEVQESKSADHPKGVCVLAWTAWESHSIVPAAAIALKIDASSPVALETYMAVLNAIIGLTAWVGVKRILEVKEGDTLCVSGAAGAVGSLVCQLGKKAGAKVVGICGSADKCEFLKKLGCAAAVNYKTDDIKAKLKEACPEGFTCYFDNVSYPVLPPPPHPPLLSEHGKARAGGSRHHGGGP